MSESDIVQDFLVESYENLDRLDRELVGLEKNPHDRDALGSVFRTIHTNVGNFFQQGHVRIPGFQQAAGAKEMELSQPSP
jgi:chemotaxis protein histidine kinase CheA